MTGDRRVIVPIVEGQGEFFAVPELLQRWLAKLGRLHEFKVADPVRTPGADALKRPYDTARELGVEHFVLAALRRDPAVIIVVLDADKECEQRSRSKAEPLGPELLRRAKATAAHKEIVVVVADPEYEAWFLRHASQVFPGLVDGPLDTPRDCKKALEPLLGRRYSATVDQKALSRRLPLPEVADIPTIADRSYRKLCKELARVLGDQ